MRRLICLSKQVRASFFLLLLQNIIMFAQKYFDRYQCLPPTFVPNTNQRLGIAVVVPCYDDEDVINTLFSLERADKPKVDVDVIVVLNSAQDTERNIVEKHRALYTEMKRLGDANVFKNIHLLPILLEDIPTKISGVGYARKVGMDEAVRRFDDIDNRRGVLVSLDSDCRVAKNYFTVIDKLFIDGHSDVATLGFEHKTHDEEQVYDTKLLKTREVACRKYELYLKYFRLSLHSTGFPYAIHTIGSCFAINAVTYIKTGGIPRLKGGEDFYFLHKAAQIAPITRVKDKIVFPSSRLSERVPFGTGRAIAKIMATDVYKVYSLGSFAVLRNFFDLIPRLFKHIDLSEIPSPIVDFYGSERLMQKLNEIRSNSKELATFCKRFFATFDAFFAVRLLNHIADYEDIMLCAKEILSYHNRLHTNELTDIYKQIDALDTAI